MTGFQSFHPEDVGAEFLHLFDFGYCGLFLIMFVLKIVRRRDPIRTPLNPKGKEPYERKDVYPGTFTSRNGSGGSGNFRRQYASLSRQRKERDMKARLWILLCGLVTL